MTQQNGSDRKSSTNKASSYGPNIVWYMILGAAAVSIILFYVITPSPFALPYPDLERLVEASRRDKSGQPTGLGSIDITSPLNQGGSEDNQGESKTFNFGNLAKVIIHDRHVEGRVDTVVTANDGTREKKYFQPFRTELGAADSSEETFLSLLKNNNFVDWNHAAEASAWQNWAPMLVFSALLILLFVMMLRRLGGAGSPMQFGRSKARLYAMEDLGVTFNDVAGIEEALEEVRELVDFLRLPEKYQKLGGRIPKGVLLVGPPGTGKTLLAKAIAGEAGVPFFSLSGSDFVEMFVGVGAARVRDMFQQAEQKAPCIIFIDELDALGKTRGASAVGGHDEREQTLNALLVEMDGFDSNAGVIVIAATNRPETLDQALLRPGRFDRHVLVDRPDLLGREDILKVHVKQVKLDDTVDLKEVAAITPGFVGADLANLVNEAALLAARAEKSTVQMNEFDEGVERVTAGLEKKQRVMREDEKHRVAYHESGHALVAYSLPNTDPVHKVSIIPRGLAALGYTMQRPEGDRFLMTQGELESQIQILLAGTVAEEMIYDEISTGAQNDLERCTDIARSMVMEFGMSRLGRVNFRHSNQAAFLAGSGGEDRGRSHSESTACEIDREVKRIIDEAMKQVRRILEERRDALVAMTNQLMEKETIDSKELKEIVEEACPGAWMVPGTDTLAKPAVATEVSTEHDSTNSDRGERPGIA